MAVGGGGVEGRGSHDGGDAWWKRKGCGGVGVSDLMCAWGVRP